MIIDVHVHTSACTPGNGMMSEHLQATFPFRFIRWKFGLVGADASTERAMNEKLVDTINGAKELDAAVVLAFDAIYDDAGNFDPRTHYFIENNCVIELAKRHRKVLFGASINPLRKDAVAELERCVDAGAVLVKWLPLVQGFDPADPRCFPFYEAMAHHRIPLLSHTGWEQALPTANPNVADPMLLLPALHRGVTVIAAHCGTRSKRGEESFLGQFVRMAHEFEHFYGDTSALNLPTRNYAYDVILEDEVVRKKLVHGSDWPIIVLPPVKRLGMACAAEMMMEPNWMRRDVLIKRRLGFDDEYWHRASRLLRLPRVGVASC
jgi:uncharacterized protein